ncbi:MAG: hypothetical protein QG657_2501 [Acidobacteriota bacterium]|nr:hypothetical protein [Acidobacteriota bacterium]
MIVYFNRFYVYLITLDADLIVSNNDVIRLSVNLIFSNGDLIHLNVDLIISDVDLICLNIDLISMDDDTFFYSIYPIWLFIRPFWIFNCPFRCAGYSRCLTVPIIYSVTISFRFIFYENCHKGTHVRRHKETPREFI